jgi:hypothetical protein
MRKTVLIIVVLSLAACAFAADKSITVSGPTNFNGKAIQPGEYKLNYEIKGSVAEMKLMRGGKTVATATGQVIEMKDPAAYNSVVNQSNPDGTSNIIEIQFAKQKTAIRLNSDASAVGK